MLLLGCALPPEPGGGLRIGVRRGLALAGCIGVIAVVTLGLMVADRPTVASASDMADVEFGEPLAWFVQDQTLLDPPTFPRQVAPLSPQEHPWDVRWERLLADVAIVGAPVVLAAAVLVRPRRSRR